MYFGTIGEEVCKIPFRFRRLKHQLFVIASKADSALGLEALDDLENLARVWATITIEKQHTMRPNCENRG